jgi:hypothetical protein
VLEVAFRVTKGDRVDLEGDHQSLRTHYLASHGGAVAGTCAHLEKTMAPVKAEWLVEQRVTVRARDGGVFAG